MMCVLLTVSFLPGPSFSIQVKQTGMPKEQLVALRFYTSHSYVAINNWMRMQCQDCDENFEAAEQHPLSAIVTLCSDGIQTLCSLNAEKKEATTEKIFYRGMKDLQLSEAFLESGGTEYGLMSSTTDVKIAVGYAVRKGESGTSLLLKIVTRNNLQRGADLSFLSMFPGESETLFPPLTFLQPTGRKQVHVYIFMLFCPCRAVKTYQL